MTFIKVEGTDSEGDPKKAIIFSLYEGYLEKANPHGFGRFIYSSEGQSGSFSGYFKADFTFNTIYSETLQKGYGFLFQNKRPKWSGYYEEGEGYLTIPSKIKAFSYFTQTDKF